MTPSIRARVGDYRLHEALALPNVASMRCNYYFSFDYHQKRPRTALHRIGWQESPEYAIGKRDQASADLLLARVAHVTDDHIPSSPVISCPHTSTPC